MQEPLTEGFTGISARSFHKGQYKNSRKNPFETTSQGFLQDLLIRICARSDKDFVARISPGSPKDPDTRTTHREHPNLIKHRPLSVYTLLAEKSRTTNGSRDGDQHFVRACKVEMHMAMSQEPSYAEICRKNAGKQIEHPDQSLAVTLTVRTPHGVGNFQEKAEHLLHFLCAQ